MEVELREAPFDPAAELAAFAAPGAGAVVTFTGVVRGDDGVERLEIEHWPGATEEAIAAMVQEARARFALSAVRVVHRHGTLQAGEPIMMVLAAAPHRRAAFEAADFLMDWLKSRAPFWKKAHRAGSAAWVEARSEDEAALSRWGDGRGPASTVS
ncbi:molybdenum cofactor biosynthesis protein MoaE [Rubellimicrobium sp. CFH 75288]|uniref:molybdenum cofactor biosynthesis protein MoaE n=1 Tax=Rubellimicrobium sp. CFH 75288 TaxID=2697034 RepID=UPI0014133943|nr:molybdenum cofactor biosynthesis protein MoaE [Rubellimicrobium sp. CFH 75288]NAZ38110.1 molybdenum cofactor biosynthesis protein MoaE [Rubellimicrobium sp. CFH 75288]